MEQSDRSGRPQETLKWSDAERIMMDHDLRMDAAATPSYLALRTSNAEWPFFELELVVGLQAAAFVLEKGWSG